MNVRVIEVDRKAIFEAHLLIDEDSIFLYMVVANALNMNSIRVEAVLLLVVSYCRLFHKLFGS